VRSDDEAADDERFRRLVGVLGAMVREPDAGAAIARDARGWLRARGLAEDDVEVLAGYPPRRLGVYRDLVRRGLAAAMRIQMPRTVRRLGDRFDAELARYCALGLPPSHYLRDAPRDLVERLGPSWSADEALPSFLVDLARHELSLYEVGAAPRRDAAVDRDALDLALPVAMDAAARLLRYEHPVHRLTPEDEALPRDPTHLLAYRDAAHEVRYLELTPFGASLTERLLAGEPLGQAVASACADVGLAVDDAALARASALLGDLAERGALLGARR
jgi:hypothetical protein